MGTQVGLVDHLGGVNTALKVAMNITGSFSFALRVTLSFFFLFHR